VEPELYEKYVKSGTLRLEWKDFPYQGRESVEAAIAARAESLTALAEEAGLDTQKFEEDLKSARYESVVQADFEEGQGLGISGTPTFFINDEVIVGLQPLGTFERAIEEAEREAEGG
jgi:protein-disulfide isomerase